MTQYNPTAPRLCLNMIVRNEAKNLPRLLDSVMPHIACAAIVDTGSTDDTKDVLWRAFNAAEKPLFLSNAPFIDYSQARNAALRLARHVSFAWDYLLLLDADHELIVKAPLPPLVNEAYMLMQDNGGARHWNVRLLRRDQTVEYEGRTHEALTCDPPAIALDGHWLIRDHETGANRPEKYQRDLPLLLAELRDHPDSPRWTYYMIQTLYGAGSLKAARRWCDKRIALGGLEEERFWASFMRAQIGQQLGLRWEAVASDYLYAYALRPIRAEPLVALAANYRSRDEPAIGLMYAREAATLPFPLDEALPVLRGVYEWQAKDEWLTCAMNAGRTREMKMAARELLKCAVPDDERDRIEANVNLALGPEEKAA